MWDQSMEVASETRGTQMKKSKQQITTEGRFHVSNEELQQQSGHYSRGVGQSGIEIFNRNGAEKLHEQNIWKISKTTEREEFGPDGDDYLCKL